MKKELRDKLLLRRQAMSAEEYQQKSEAICRILMKNEIIAEAERVHIYYPMRQEVDVRPFIEYLWSIDKKVIMPRADFKSKEMTNYYVINFGQLEKTRYGLLEPRTNSPLHLGSPDVVIVPGVAFSRKRYRLGYGGGFYDRFLDSIITTSIGVGFELQMVDNLVVEPHDQQLDLVITEKKIYK